MNNEMTYSHIKHSEIESKCEVRKAAISFHSHGELNKSIIRVIGNICYKCGNKACVAGAILIEEAGKAKNLCLICAAIMILNAMYQDFDLRRTPSRNIRPSVTRTKN